MSRGGCFKDFGNFGQLINLAASEINSTIDTARSSIGNAVGAALGGQQQQQQQQQQQPEQQQQQPEQQQSSRDRPRASSTASSSQATTPDDPQNNYDWFQQIVNRGCGGRDSVGSGGLSGSGGVTTTTTTNRGTTSREGCTTSEGGGSGVESGEAPAMTCDNCNAKFTLWTRKKACSECKVYFCSNCVSREAPSGRRNHGLNARTCTRCKVLLSQPPIRADLMELRVKDLQRYLVSKHINTKACVEKKDLVELVIRQNGAATTTTSSSGAATSPTAGAESARAPGSQVPFERQRSFPKAYVQSTHRHEWFAKHEDNGASSADNVRLQCDEDNDDDFVVVTPVQPMQDTAATVAEDANNATEEVVDPSTIVEETPVEVLEPSHDDDEDDDDEMPSLNVQGAEAVSLAAEAVEQETASSLPGDKEVEPTKLPPASAEDDKVMRSPESTPKKSSLQADAKMSPCSPRRFANQGLVYLSGIEKLEDIQELSVKQAKDILAMNRVNFKGVVEKEELLKYVERLWKQDHQAQTEKDSMTDSELCKICMDAPVDCVMLECGHMCTCTTCGKQMAECPICRQYVVRVVRTFKA